MAVDRMATYVGLAARLKALSHPARLEILRVLAEHGTCICGAIVEGLPLAQSTVSQHLKVLKEAGFVKGEVEGPRSCYCLDRDAIERFRDDFAELFGRLDESCTPDRGEAHGRAG